jgi:hypothetical protein
MGHLFDRLFHREPIDDEPVDQVERPRAKRPDDEAGDDDAMPSMRGTMSRPTAT